MRLTILSLCLLAAPVVVLGGCGIKPRDVDPPTGVNRDTFPKTYPDPATDPHK